VWGLQEDLLPYRVAEVSIGAHHWVARTVEGCVFSVGSSPDGALGLGSKRTEFKRLTLVPSLRNAGLAVTALSCGPHTTAFIANGALFITGELCGGTVGSLGLVPTSTCPASSGSPLSLSSDSLASSVSMRSPALLSSPQGFESEGFDSAVDAADKNVFTPMMVTAVPAGTSFKQVACAGGVVVSLDASGRVWSWGATTVMLGLGDDSAGVAVPTQVTTFLGASAADSSDSRSSKSRSKKTSWAPLGATPVISQIAGALQSLSCVFRLWAHVLLFSRSWRGRCDGCG
jgi:alpha-tubulin suppressor-like RCC1 family protein